MRESRVIALAGAALLPAVVWAPSFPLVAALLVVCAGYCFARESEERAERSQRIHKTALSAIDDLQKLTQGVTETIARQEIRLVTVENRTRKPGER